MMWQRTEQSDNQWSRFMNKIDLVADYQLRPQQKHSIQRYFDLLKAKFFWQLTTQHHDGQSGVVRASIIIDPMTRRHANVTVQTPQERLRIQSVQVPTTILVAVAYPLERRPSNLRSIGDLFQSVSSFGGAECRFNERRVRTFDGTAYKAPISSCWSVLAKDCSREEPRFVVMMKKTDEEKKLRIITQDNTIELIGQSENEKVKVMVDGEHVKDEERLSDEGIEVNFNNVYVSKRGINVEFDGQEAKVKIGGQYKNLQCGLCGHYNDEEDDVFRMGNNQRSNNLKEFHRSYTMKNEECEEGKLEQVLPTKRQQVLHSSTTKRSPKSSSMEWQNSDEQDDQKQVQPVKRTQVIEYNHKVCFSSEPVERCPRGSTPDDDAETKPVKAQFFLR
ncbi:Vit-6 [Aphelenchoides besseyi]|nr:Vit-6 [Aphelenchoides besseyi]